ncbi:hypothetical protein HMPREF3159_00875 [Brachybacterium sp. HMSC06H03]|uniref:sensor histidine kinase n=1 Tax=Brachybacterium sp. HMSC06H03 TaxID=1581127 RepID=UPI0008A5A5BF|nr:HAMP domain-containing sensor histidine kinase [Brachybacterium sp. HMSC06H03]OFT65637.1 hypothetical protein HMPREF3159_00875 [Brachybacterium sp. HMSC06H03]
MKGIPWYASLRFRFAAVLAVTSFAIAALLGAWIAHVALGDARDQMREQAAATLRAGTATYETTRTVAPTVQIGEKGLPSGLAQRAREHDDIVTSADERETWAAVQAQDGTTLSVRLPSAPVVERWEELARTILALSLAVAAAASGIGWFVSGGLTRRLRRAAEITLEGGDVQGHDAALARLRADADGAPRRDAPRRTPSGEQDEVGVLTGVIEDTTRRLLLKIQQERALTADAAHELRTPLTALTSAVELLDDSAEAERVRTLLGRMRRLVDDMLSLAREDAADQADRDVVRTEDLAREAAGSGPGEVEVQVETPGRVRCDEQLVVSVLESLVLNAVRHGAPPITIEVDGEEIRVRDRGPGFPDEILTDGPRRFHSIGPTGGSGLGLVIAQRRLERTGGTLAFGGGGEARSGEDRSGEDGPQGAVVTVRLEPAS